MSGEAQDDVWPLPKFYFSVTFGGDITASFQEVSGLGQETQTIEYRAGNSPIFAPIKMPGLSKVGNVTMKKGIFLASTELWTWFNQIKMNTITRQPVVVTLLDQTGAAKMVWTLNNAFPAKMTGTDLKGDGNEVAIESLEIAYETMTVAIP